MKKLKKQILTITALAIAALFMNYTVTGQNWGTQDTTVQDTSQVETESLPQEQNQGIDTTSQDTSQSESQAFPQEQNQMIDETRSGSGTMGSQDDISAQDHDEGVEYSEELEKEDLPQEVNSSLQELYPSHEISEVYRGDDDSYKVKVKNQNDEAVVYYSSEGSFERARNLSGLQQDGAFPQQQGQRTMEGMNQDTTGTQSEWGTGTDTLGTQGTQQGTQGQWGAQDNDNEGSAFPQEQNQETDDGFGTQGDRDINNDWGTDRPADTGTDIGGENETGTGIDTQDETDNPGGTGTDVQPDNDMQ